MKRSAMAMTIHPLSPVLGAEIRGIDLCAGPIQQLFDWSDDTGPSTELKARIVSIEVVDTVAILRLELENLAGSRYTDMFTLLKIEGEWKIMNKVFHLHS